jgi:hypothetical protein
MGVRMTTRTSSAEMRPKTTPLAITHRVMGSHFESAPYRPSPARRDFIHGPIQPMEPDKSKAKWLVLGLVAALIFIGGITL